MALDAKNFIAKRVAEELNAGEVVNLGIGLPTLVANYVDLEKRVIFQAENGILGVGEAAKGEIIDNDIFDAGCTEVTVVPGSSFMDSSASFGLIRGGHVHATVLGAMQVDEKGNLANWAIPGRMVVGFGGAMDLVVGAKKVIVAMEHSSNGKPKLLKECTYPLTAVGVVNTIITEMVVIDVTKEGFVVREITEGLTLEDVQAVTEAKLHPAKDMKIMKNQ